jgi:hypothetical protein
MEDYYDRSSSASERESDSDTDDDFEVSDGEGDNPVQGDPMDLGEVEGGEGAVAAEEGWLHPEFER